MCVYYGDALTNNSRTALTHTVTLTTIHSCFGTYSDALTHLTYRLKLTHTHRERERDIESSCYIV